MTLKLKRAGRYCIYGALVGGILSVIALILVVSQSGYAQPSAISTIVVYVAYWPMLLMGWSTHSLFVSFWVLPANVIVWSLTGFLVGSLRRQQNENL